jgi:hypothetical protein
LAAVQGLAAGLFAAPLRRSRQCGQLLLPLGGQGRNPAVRRIDNDGGPARFDDLGSRVPPKIVVGAGNVSLGAAVALVAVALPDRLLFVGAGFLLAEEFFPGQVPGALEGRNRHVGPDAVEVGMAIGHARHGRAFPSGRRRSRLSCRRIRLSDSGKRHQ